MENGNPPGAPEQTGESTSKSRGDAILAELEANMGKFASIATSVKDMSASIASLRTDINELKRKRTPDQDSDDQGPSSKKDQSDEPEEMDSSDDDDEFDDELEEFLSNKKPEAEEDDFWQDLNDFVAENEDVGEEVSEKIASISQKALQCNADEKKIKEIKERNKRPKNIPNLKIPQVDEFLWRQLRASTRNNDFILQKMHNTLASTAVPIIKALDHLQTSNDNKLKAYLSDAFKLITNGISKNVEVRREKIKREMAPKYKHLAKLEKSADKLFGDKLSDNIKAVDNTKIVVAQTQTSNMRPTVGQNFRQKGKKVFLGQRNRWEHNNPTGYYPQSQKKPMRKYFPGKNNNKAQIRKN
ncbi:uncharacterized protein LOC127846495 isoform X2 [Dreissena polymorpha]|uniref:Uncharacterized protein n=1 Tax=Dreissena polymorpha TaxID=45954 RepID=A0A9D4E4W5_DREPO|nr:uncharacterized protein LOC127846495 isoform X2 [Dreissena polymorpha]KAH3773183.1 hypothetical protein DPMN_174540 [Dreissena polymorpha]